MHAEKHRAANMLRGIPVALGGSALADEQRCVVYQSGMASMQ